MRNIIFALAFIVITLMFTVLIVKSQVKKELQSAITVGNIELIEMLENEYYIEIE